MKMECPTWCGGSPRDRSHAHRRPKRNCGAFPLQGGTKDAAVMPRLTDGNYTRTIGASPDG